MPGYAFSHVDKYLAASRFCPLLPPAGNQLGKQHMQTLLISSTALLPLIRLVGIRIWG